MWGISFLKILSEKETDDLIIGETITELYNKTLNEYIHKWKWPCYAFSNITFQAVCTIAVCEC